MPLGRRSASICDVSGADTHTDRRLLVGFTAGEHGEAALALADVLCELTGARPTVLRVLPVARYLLGDDPDLALELETADELAVARERLARFGPRTHAVCDVGVARGLFEEADRDHASIIVVGSTHRGRLGRLLPGGTATALLHGAPAAVAVAPLGYGAGEPPRIERIGVAIDGSEESLTALAGGVELAAAAGAELRLFTAADPASFGYGALIETLTAGEIESHVTEHARRVLVDAAASVPDSIPVQTHLIHGDVSTAMDEESGRLDLLLLGSRGYGPLRRTLLGSVSGHIVDNARCPVLITPRGAGAVPFDVGADAAPDPSG